MNHVGIKQTSEKLFWLSLIIYCIGFVGFYFTTQYTFNKIEQEEQTGVFSKFKDFVCDSNKVCTNISFQNTSGIDSPFYKTHVEVVSKHLDTEALQSRYEAFMQQLPWFVSMQFQKELVIDKLNNQPFKGSK